MDAKAAMKKEIMMLGPAVSLATSPERTYTPAPKVLPTPRATRSRVVRHRLKVDCSPSGSMGFLRDRLTRKDLTTLRGMLLSVWVKMKQGRFLFFNLWEATGWCYQDSEHKWNREEGGEGEDDQKMCQLIIVRSASKDEQIFLKVQDFIWTRCSKLNSVMVVKKYQIIIIKKTFTHLYLCLTGRLMRHNRVKPQIGLMHVLLYLPVIGIVLMPGVFRGQKKTQPGLPFTQTSVSRTVRNAARRSKWLRRRCGALQCHVMTM